MSVPWPTVAAVEETATDTLPVEAPRGPALSPSRAADFMTCPLLYRFRVIDRLPEPPSPAAARGTLVHAVLEHLFDEPAAGRTPEAARSLLGPEWDRLLAAEPALAGLFVIIDSGFFAANSMKIAEGGYVPLLLAASEEVKAAYLPPVARGEAMFSYALSEP